MELHEAINMVMKNPENVRSWYPVDYQDIRSIINGYLKNREIVTDALALCLGESFSEVEETVYKVMSAGLDNCVRYEDFSIEDWRNFKNLFIITDVMEGK